MKISILIRSRNDGAVIEQTMQRLLTQKTDIEYELVNIDNGSSDRTCEVIEKYNRDGLILHWSQPYVPGKVLNFAIGKCAGDIVVFHNSDCIPQGENYLAELVKPLLADRAHEIAAVYARQIPRPNATPLIRKDYQRGFGDGSISRTWRFFFSLAAAAIPKALLLQHPFDESIQYSEDIFWAWNAKQRGGRIVYAPEAVVEHSHNYSLAEARKRFFNEGIADARIFGDRPDFWRGFLLPLGREYLRDVAFLIREREFAAAPRELAFRLVQRFSHYRGLRKAAQNGR